MRRGIAARVLPEGESVWIVLRVHCVDGGGPSAARRARASARFGGNRSRCSNRLPRIPASLAWCCGFWGLRRVGVKCIRYDERSSACVKRASPVAAYAETLDAPGYLLATAASEIWLPEAGNLFLVGLRAGSYFFRGLLENLGVRPEVVRAGDYKAAAERFTRDRMSREGREQVEALVDDLFSELVDGIAAGRGLKPASVRELIDRGPFHARAATEAGLIDSCLYPDEIEEKLAQLCEASVSDSDGAPEPSRPKVRLVDAVSYRNIRVSARAFVPIRARFAAHRICGRERCERAWQRGARHHVGRLVEVVRSPARAR